MLDGRASRLARPLFLAACVLTMLIYPGMTNAIPRGEDSVFLLFNLRNLALVALFAVLTFSPSSTVEGETGVPAGPMI